jgi:hypothetical protein
MNPHNQMTAELQSLFDLAACKSIAMFNDEDAEEEMSKFLQFVKLHPSLKGEVMKLFSDAFSEKTSYSSWPNALFMYCMHSLRWECGKMFILSKKEEDYKRNGNRMSNLWTCLLEAFEDDWYKASIYREFRKVENERD